MDLDTRRNSFVCLWYELQFVLAGSVLGVHLLCLYSVCVCGGGGGGWVGGWVGVFVCLMW